MKIMQCMDYHTHIVNLQGFKINQPDPTFSMVLEYCSKGSLFNYLGIHIHLSLFFRFHAKHFILFSQQLKTEKN